MDLSTARKEFPITERFAFPKHAGISSFNRRASQAVQAPIEQSQMLPRPVYRRAERPGIAPHFFNSDEDVLRVGEVLGNRTLSRSHWPAVLGAEDELSSL